jgi:hypothetical protein
MKLCEQPEWYDKFIALIEFCWEHHGPCQHLHSKCWYDADGVWLITVAPVFQEVLGGEDDGKKVWTGFIFHSDAFCKADGVSVESFAAGSVCSQCSPHPRLMFRGEYRGHRFYLQVFLEPPRDVEVVEVIDTIRCEVRPK